ncbi:MAG: S41 family peptidase [Christensenellales bacterium]|jgi:hypothetical protein
MKPTAHPGAKDAEAQSAANKPVSPALRRACRIAGVLLLAAAVLFGSYRLFLDPYRGTVESFSFSQPLDQTLSKEQALDDLALMMRYLEQRHPACIKGVPEDVSRRYRQEAEALPEKVTVLELWRATAAVMARVGDAHTGVGYMTQDPSRLPAEFEMQGGVLYMLLEDQPARVLEIGGMPPQTLFEAFADRFSYEQESYAHYRFAQRLAYRAHLAFMGVQTAGDGVEITYETPEGRQSALYAFALPDEDDAARQEPFVSYEIDAGQGLGTLYLRACVYDDEYRFVLKDFFTQVKRDGIGHVAVDLRGNGGGNSRVIDEFMRYLNVDMYYTYGGVDVRYGPYLWKNARREKHNRRYDDLTFGGEVYALTSVDTFSSALDFATAIQDNGIGRIIGETPGGMPATYGDVLRFQLPESGLAVSVSYKYFGRIDQQKSHLPLIPDISCDAREAYGVLLDYIPD